MAHNSHASMDTTTESVAKSLCDTVSDGEINNDIADSVCKSEDLVNRQECGELSTFNSR